MQEGRNPRAGSLQEVGATPVAAGKACHDGRHDREHEGTTHTSGVALLQADTSGLGGRADGYSARSMASLLRGPDRIVVRLHLFDEEGTSSRSEDGAGARH